MKKLLCTILMVLLMVALLAGCGGGGGESANGVPTNENGVPIITIGVKKSPYVADYNNNHFTQWLEEQAGVDIQIIEFAGAVQDYKTQFATMIASGETLPDIIWGWAWGDDLRNSYGEQGYFIDLKPFFDNKELSKAWWDGFEQLSAEEQSWFYHKNVNENTGAMYAMPYIAPCPGDQEDFQPWINQNWLDKLGLSVPTNTEELINVLTAFRDRDPNGNNQKDEIPCMGSTSDSGGDAVSWLVNMKMYCDDGNWVNIDENGKVYAPATTDEYRKAIQWVHDLMAEGLVSPLSVTTKQATLKTNLAAGDLIGLFLGHPMIVIKSAETMQKWTPVPLWGNAYYNDTPQNYGTVITEDCAAPELAWKILMAACSEEGTIIQRYGEEGVNWEYPKEGEVSVVGGKPSLKVITDVWNETQSTQNWRATSVGLYVNPAHVSSGNHVISADMSKEDVEMYKKYALQGSYYREAEARLPACAVPRLKWTSDQKRESPYRNDVTSLFGVYTDKFVTGQLNPYSDADWNKYLDELKDATYDKWLTVVQKVVDSMIERGEFTPKK